jgi:serine/threonine protein kinase
MRRDSANDARIGQLVAGQYLIEAPLGAGGMGCVYRARQQSVNRPVALKLLQPQALGSSDAVRRFQREAEAMARLQHHHNVRLYDYGVSENGEPFIAMELLEGESLDTRLGRGALRPELALTITEQVLRALGEAHEIAIVHRDLKPSNIFLCRMPEQEVWVRVLDFGIARLDNNPMQSALTGPGVAIGTVLYMSPEQVACEPCDARSDLYSVGLILFEMLSGRRAYSAASQQELMLSRLTRDPPPLAEYRPDLGGQIALQALLDALLARHPDHRLQSATVALAMVDQARRSLVAATTGTQRMTSHSGVQGSSESNFAPTYSEYAPRTAAPSLQVKPTRAPVLFAGLLVTGASVAAAMFVFSFDRDPIGPPDPPVVDGGPAAVPQRDMPAAHRVVLNSVPTGANVRLRGALLGTTPLQYELTGDQDELLLSMDGYEDERVALTRTTQREFQISLRQRTKARGANSVPRRGTQGSTSTTIYVVPDPSLNQVQPQGEVYVPPPPLEVRVAKPCGDVPSWTPLPVPKRSWASNMFRADAHYERRAAMLRSGPPCRSVATADRARAQALLSATDYEDTIWVLKQWRSARLETEKARLNSGALDRASYDARLREINAEYEGKSAAVMPSAAPPTAM